MSNFKRRAGTALAWGAVAGCEIVGLAAVADAARVIAFNMDLTDIPNNLMVMKSIVIFKPSMAVAGGGLGALMCGAGYIGGKKLIEKSGVERT